MTTDQTPGAYDTTDAAGRNNPPDRLPDNQPIIPDQVRGAEEIDGEKDLDKESAAVDRESDLTPDAIEAHKVESHRRPLPGALVRARGVEWIRPTDSLARQTAPLAGRGIDFQADLSRRTRQGAVAAARAAGDRARRLPPLSAFGRGRTPQSVSRSAVGMS
ncbi:hypothetical protein [Kocuria carniphila]|uniref:hypothetical protein n=1 Tax=Kocuria carniphila TaxID=262208 RepID=UPI0028EA648C|nr:hypothetical protein [Kocuria carniphila]